MNDEPGLVDHFERSRDRLRAVAYRMLGSVSEADDAVQEAWLRLHRSDVGEVENLSAWLTTVVARVCLDMLRSRKVRREDELPASHDTIEAQGALNPERATALADAVGPALLVVLAALPPAERLAFVLHDMFAIPFEEIAPIVGCSSSAARQLASRGRRRVRGGATADDVDLGRKREVVAAFLGAARDGRFEALLAVLDPDVVLRADGAAIALGSAPEVRGAEGVARTFSGRASEARHALVEATAGAAWVPAGRTKVAMLMTIIEGRIAVIDLVGDFARLAEPDMVILDA